MLNEETSIIYADDLTKINEFINRPEEIFTNFDDKLSLLQWFHLWFVHTSLHCSLRLVVDVHFQRLLIRNIPVDTQSVPSILSPEMMVIIMILKLGEKAQLATNSYEIL